MSKSVNLLSSKKDYLEREQTILKILRGIAVSLLISVAIISVLTFIIGAAIPISSIKQQENLTLASIATLHKKLATYEFSKDRIKNILTELSARQDLTKIINTISSNVPDGVKLNTISIENGKLSLTFTSDSLIDINMLIDNMYSLGNKKNVIKDVILESLSLNPATNSYFVSMKAMVF